MSIDAPVRRTYSYLGPAGTFTEAALSQVPEARDQIWRPVRNVGEALADVVEGRSDAAMIAIENSVDGGVSTAQDALATMPGLRIVGEYLVPVEFVLVAKPGVRLEDVSVVAAHPVAYAQCLQWLSANLPEHAHLPAASNVASAVGIVDGVSDADAAIAPPGILEHYDLELLAEGIGDNVNAVTRFVLVSRTVPPANAADERAARRLASAERSRSPGPMSVYQTLVVRKTSPRGTPEARNPSPTSTSPPGPSVPGFARWFGVTPSVTPSLRARLEADIRGA